MPVLALFCIGLLTLSLSTSTLFASTAKAKSAKRIWHVSPQLLPEIGIEKQFRTISDAVKVVKPGDTVIIHTGTYRETVTFKKEQSGTPERPITFMAAPAAHVVVTGADRITNWTKVEGAGNIYSTPWPYVFLSWSPMRAHPDDDEHVIIGRCEQVFVMGYPLRQVLHREEMARGTFYVDEQNKLLYAWAMTNAKLTDVPVEASTRPLIWDCQASYIHTRGLHFRYAACSAQQSAVGLNAHDVIEDCVIEKMNGAGLGFGGEGVVVRRCIMQDNGQLGFGGGGANHLLMTGCIIRNNNVKGFERGWEAGGDKICFSHGVVIEHCQFLENRGCGIWFDIANHDCTVRNCLIANNEDAGIFSEFSYGLHGVDNVIIGNGFADTPGAWGAAAGICLSSSPNCVIERNLLIGNKEGFNFREQDRTTPNDNTPGKEVWVWNHDQLIRNNVLAYNRDAQTWGWFDTDTQEWPANTNTPTTVPAGKAQANLAAKYIVADNGNYPHLTLENLNLNFSNNFYAVADGEELFHWGAAWHRNKAYPTLDAVRKELHLDQGSVVGRFDFADYPTLDFRVPAHSRALKMGCYPQGEVPGVTLGVQ
jgi:parallel beta-helix repeat protein